MYKYKFLSRLSICPLISGIYLNHRYKTNVSFCDSINSDQEKVEKNKFPKSFDDIEFNLFQNERILRIYGPIDSKLAIIIINSLEVLDQKDNKPIKLIINSGGGNISQGLAICDKMNKIESKVYTQCEGDCSSIAAIILANGFKGHRSITPNSTVFIHEAYLHFPSEISLSIFELNGRLQSLKIHREQIIEILIKITGKTKSEIEYIMRNDITFTALEAIEHCLVDKIIYCNK